ncbi:hypothetical protein ACMFMF_010253 [Clarireedia jacksonii]
MARESDGGELWPMSPERQTLRLAHCNSAIRERPMLTNHSHSATSNEQRATSNEQRATSNEQPATSNQQPATSTALREGTQIRTYSQSIQRLVLSTVIHHLRRTLAASLNCLGLETLYCCEPSKDS